MGTCLRLRRSIHASNPLAHLSIVLPASGPAARLAVKRVHADPSVRTLTPLKIFPFTRDADSRLRAKRPRDGESVDNVLDASTSSRPSKLHKAENGGDVPRVPTTWMMYHHDVQRVPSGSSSSRVGSWSSNGEHPTFGSFGLNFHAKGAPLLYVFDFDQTILRIHSFGSRIRPEDVDARDLNADVADPEFFRAFVGTLRANGVCVAVASFGEYAVIQNYLDRIAPGVFNRGSICTPSCVGHRDGCAVPEGKVPMLERLVQQLLGSHGRKGEEETAASGAALRARTVLVDDCAANVKGARAAGYLGGVAPDAFTRRAWPTIRKGLPRGVLHVKVSLS